MNHALSCRHFPGELRTLFESAMPEIVGVNRTDAVESSIRAVLEAGLRSTASLAVCTAREWEVQGMHPLLAAHLDFNNKLRVKQPQQQPQSVVEAGKQQRSLLNPERNRTFRSG